MVSPVSPGIDSEAVRVIRSSPKWLPGHLTIDGPPVRARWICIVNFRILPGYNRENAFNIVIRDNIKPAFPGGKVAFDNYIRSNASYAGPPYGRVTVHYQVEKTGEVKNIKILRSLSPAADAEAIRLLEQSPPWEPRLLNGTYKSMMGDTLSVWFKLR